MNQIVPVLPYTKSDDFHFNINDLESLPRHPLLEELTKGVGLAADVDDEQFSRLFVIGTLMPLVASMRVRIDTERPGNSIPVNAYVLACAPSGYGKNKSEGYLEAVTQGFNDRFIKETYPIAVENNLWTMATENASWSGETEQKEYDKLKNMFRREGAYVPVARSFTEARIGQMRNKTILANAGCVNLVSDEIGSNLTSLSGQYGPMKLFLSLYDMGKMKMSETKVQKDDEEVTPLDGWAASCAMLFGEPQMLLDGGDVQQKLFELLTTGYGRRCLYAWGEEDDKPPLSPREQLERARSNSQAQSMDRLVRHFTEMANIDRLNWHVSCSDDALVAYLAYKTDCLLRSRQISPEMSILRNEVKGRYFKALKIAGMLAFIDESQTCEMHHLGAAIRICEEQSDALIKVLFQEPSHVRLANWLASKEVPVTHADIFELPFMQTFRSDLRRKEQLSLAASWGYSNNIIIKRYFVDTIELFEAETLKETDLSKLRLSYSNDPAKNYQPMLEVPWQAMEELVSKPDLNWCNHTFEGNHRREAHIQPGFNMIVLDCDGDVSLNTVHEMFADTTFMTYTTKRHQTEGKDRFRLILPTNYVLEMDVPTYMQFMDGVLEYMPFWTKEKSDGSPRKPEVKWLTNPDTEIHYNEGKLFDVLPFIPKTSRNQEHKKNSEPLRDLGNLERYFLRIMGDGNSGNRNHTIARYAFALVDANMSLAAIEAQVRALNAQLPNPLDPSELTDTVLKSAAQRCMERDG